MVFAQAYAWSRDRAAPVLAAGGGVARDSETDGCPVSLASVAGEHLNAMGSCTLKRLIDGVIRNREDAGRVAA